jgi:hypothetical protein
MPASGKPVTGKGGTVTFANVTGATTTFTLACEVQTYSYENTAEVVRGSRLSGLPFKESGDEDYTGEVTIYVAKSDAGVTLPFKAGDTVDLAGTFGGNTIAGDVLITSVGVPQIERGSFCTLTVRFEQNDSTFAVQPKVITVA